MATARGPWGDVYEVEEPAAVTTEPTPEIVPEVTATITPAVVEPEQVVTPVVETTEPVVETPVVETVVTPEPTVKEVIKEVEKIVEKYPEMDGNTKEIFDALMEGKEDVLLAYLSEKHKDYKTMSDYDVVKENLKKANPTWTPQEIELEVKYKYGENLIKIDLTTIDKDIEPQEYQDALRHNRDVERNEVLLARDARDSRIALEQTKKEIKLPKLEKAVEEPAPTGPTEEEIQQYKDNWKQLVHNEIPNLKEFTFKVGDKETGYEDVVYNVTDAQRSEQAQFLEDMDFNKMVTRLGWVDKDGKQNVAKMAGDVLKLENVAQLIQSAYTQGRTAGAKGTIGDIKNIDLKAINTSTVQSLPPDIGSVVWGHLNPK